MSQGPHLRLPPDSTGKRLSTGVQLEIDYIGLQGDIQLNDNVTGSVSGFLGSVVKILPGGPTTGEVYVNLAHEAPEAVVSGETLTFDGVHPVGTAQTSGTGTPLYTSKTHLMGINNPFNGQHVDVRGAASVTFSEGAPMFDAFGGQKVSDPSTIGVYEFSSDGGFGMFSTEIVGGATEVYNPLTSTVDLTCTAAAGDSVIRTSNKCHYYWPGNGTTIIMSAALSDLGVVGNTRRMGFFDVSDGIYFEMKDTVAYICLRSSSLGTTTRVPQSEWNVDRLDGTGLSGIEAVWSNEFVYFIDLQWIGSGRARAGVLGPEGTRVICHEFRNSGGSIYPYMKTGSLPVRVENFNTANTGSLPQIRVACMVVKCDGKVDYTYYRNNSIHPPVAVGGDLVPLISLRAKPLYGGRRNPTNAFPEQYTCYVTGGVVRVDFCWPITLTGATWAVDYKAMEVDLAATAAVIDDDYWLYASYYLGAGAHVIDLRPFSDSNDEGIITNADGTLYAWNVVATKIEGTPSIQGALSWKELR